MKKVEFVKCESMICGIGFGKGKKFEFYKIEEKIKKRIEDGWDFQGYVPLITRDNGEAEVISLIFVKEEE